MLRRLAPIFLAGLVTIAVLAGAPAGAATKSQAIPFTAATVTQTADGFAVEWAAPSSAGTVKVYAGTDPSAVGTSNQVGQGKSTGSIDVAGLAPAPRWYFELVPAKGGSLVIADRSLHLASAPNFRDVGGYRTGDGKWVKMGLLYRSDGLDALTDADIATVQALGIKLVCDLRTDGERTSKPDKEIPGATNEQINIIGEDELTKQITAAVTGGDKAAQEKFLGNGKAEQLLVDGGRSFVSGATPLAEYRQLFSRIEDPNYLPTLMHCSAGKDRTGWGSAAVLTALGVPKATVMQDYLLSNEYLQAKNEKTYAQTATLIDRSLLEPVLTVKKQYLGASFSEVAAKYKTFDKYLAAIGVTAAAKAKLQQELLAG